MQNPIQITPGVVVTSPNSCVIAIVKSPLQDTKVWLRSLGQVSAGNAANGQLKNGYHVYYKIFNGDGSIAVSEVELTASTPSFNIPMGGRVEIRAINYVSAGNVTYKLDQLNNSSSSGGENCESAALQFITNTGPQLSITLLISTSHFAVFTPANGAVPIDHMFTGGVKATVTGTSNLPAAITAIPQFSGDGIEYAAGPWSDHTPQKFVRVQLSDGSGTTSNVAQVVSSIGNTATLQFGFGGNFNEGSSSVTIELKEEGFTGGRPKSLG